MLVASFEASCKSCADSGNFCETKAVRVAAFIVCTVDLIVGRLSAAKLGSARAAACPTSARPPAPAAASAAPAACSRFSAAPARERAPKQPT